MVVVVCLASRGGGFLLLTPHEVFANEPGRLGDQSRWMGRIRSRITNDVIEKTLVELKL